MTRATVLACKREGVRVGAHPGYPDREGFGRRKFAELGLDFATVLDSLLQQMDVIPKADYLKPHGALYNEAAADEASEAGQLVFELLRRWRLPLMGLPGTGLEKLAAAIDVPFIREGFIDRGYRADGRLLPRSEPGAILQHPAESVAQAIRLADRCDSLCVHGDTPGAIKLALQVRDALLGEGYQLGW